jgi:eukaryotic-like serine/threonine-protein kinase
MQRSFATLAAGQLLQKRYQVVRKLGAGGYGSVYLAEDTRLPGRRVAAKELSDPSPAARELFEHEAAILASLNHTGLVRVSDFFSEGRSSYLVMEYIEGQDLLDLAIEAEKSTEMLAVDQVVDWMLQVCEAVAYLHRREPPVVHRDIKPNNIRLSDSGRATLVDFGIAKVDPNTKTQKIAKAVSEGFSPPEQYGGGGSTNTRSDVYALGATLYCLLTVTPPPDSFERLTRDVALTPPRKINPAVGAELEQVVLKAMSLNALSRYHDAGDMLAAMQAALGRPVSVMPARLGAPRAAALPALKSPGETACPQCRARVRSGARFCQTCGANLISGVPCSQCGTLNRPAARFCSRCRAPMAPLDVGQPPVSRSPQPHISRGDRYLQSDDYAGASAEYEMALQLGAGAATVYGNLAHCYLKLSRFDDAVALLEPAVGTYPKDAALSAQLAMAYLESKNVSQGLQTLQMAYSLNPQDAAIASLLCTLYAEGGQHGKAVPILEQLLQADPGNEQLQSRLAMGYFMTNNLREAESLVKRLQRNNPKAGEYSFLMGMICLGKGNTKLALRELQTAVNQEPQHALAHYFMGEIYFRQKRWRDALAAYQASARANPRDADAPASMCLCYLALGRKTEALDALQTASRIDPNNRLALEIAAALAK